MLLKARLSGLVSLASVALALALTPPASAATTVTIFPWGFVPDPVVIGVGETVTWVNGETIDHQVVADDGSFISPLLRPGATYAFTFAHPGQFPYHDGVWGKLAGTVVVSAGGEGAQPGTASTAKSVTLSVSRPTLVYGGRVTVRGTVSSRDAGEKVALLDRRHGRSHFARIATVTTGAGGAWRYVLKPQLSTVFRARWGTSATADGSVAVRPRVLLSVRQRVFSIDVEAARSFKGKVAYLQRRSRVGRWVSLARAMLDGASSAQLEVELPSRSSAIRALLPRSQAGPGYLAGISRTVVVRGR